MGKATSEKEKEVTAKNKDKTLKKLNTQFNEERLLKDLTSIQLARIKNLDELSEEISNSEKYEEIIKTLHENLNDSPASFVSRYLIGLDALRKEDSGESSHLLELLREFRNGAKWTIVDHISDHILKSEPENRLALRAKVESTERIKGKKELTPYLEKLATIDRKNPDILKKYALNILADDKEKALKFLKQAGEIYARTKDYNNLEDVWSLVIDHDHSDIPFFERIERVLVGNREKTRVAAMYVSVLEPYRVEENWNVVINILKKILQYEPTSTRSRSDLVRTYRAKYADHSLLDEFLKMSELTNNKRPVGPCIASFERNIVFDNKNYVFHRTRGVGKIILIDSTQVIIDFRDNPGQRMTIQMAISSLKPLGTEHIWVRYYENPDEINEIFKDDVPLFFEILLFSFGYKMSLAEIKAEVSNKFIPAAEWSKWWSRSRAKLKKEPKFGFNPRKKDELHLRETPMTLAEELGMKFQAVTDWDKKFELAGEILKNPDTESAAQLCSQFYSEQEDNKDTLKKIHSYLFLTAVNRILGEDVIKGKLTSEFIEEIISKEPAETIVEYCAHTVVLDFKRELINIIVKIRKDYPEILTEILLKFPGKINKYIVTELTRLENFDALTEFLTESFKEFRKYPESFLWAARSILGDLWTEDWVKFSKEEVTLLVFRLLKPLARYEKKGTKLKNMAIDTIFGTTNITVESAQKGTLPGILKAASLNTIRRMSVIFKEVPYVPDAHKENFLALIQEIRSDYNFEPVMEDEDTKEKEEEPLFPEQDIVLVSTKGLEIRRAHLDHLVNVDMVANSREIGEAQEKGDLRENAEYKAAMEKQSQLQAEIKKISEELQKAKIIDPDKVRTDVVSIGSQVELKTPEGDIVKYKIFGPWEADTKKQIISYLSPLGMSLIGKKAGEKATLKNNKVFQVKNITCAL